MLRRRSSLTRRRIVPVAEKIDDENLRWDPEVGPTVLSTGDRLAFAFVHVDGSARVVSLTNCVASRFGAPGRDAQPGHPLWATGLETDSAHVVTNSPWLDGMQTIATTAAPGEDDGNGSPEPQLAGLPDGCRHYVFTFCDSILEALATDFAASRHRDLSSALRGLPGALKG